MTFLNTLTCGLFAWFLIELGKYLYNEYIAYLHRLYESDDLE